MISPENNTKNAQAITNNGALIKKRKGKSIGGKAVNDKPDMFMATFLNERGYLRSLNFYLKLL